MQFLKSHSHKNWGITHNHLHDHSTKDADFHCETARHLHHANARDAVNEVVSSYVHHKTSVRKQREQEQIFVDVVTYTDGLVLVTMRIPPTVEVVIEQRDAQEVPTV